MILEFPTLGGTKVVQADADVYEVSASVSAPATMELTVYDGVDGTTQIEHVYVGPYSPHTWWAAAGIPLLKGVKAGGRVKFVATGAAAVRIEGPFSEAPA